MNENLEKHSWWNYINEDLKDLMKESYFLIKKVEDWKERFHDYAFVIFPAAKAYEGFLKTLFHDMGLITDEEYFGKRFRVGKALNPALEESLREKESVYDKLADFCQGKILPDSLWKTWKEARNRLFHWFPNEAKAINYSQAYEKFILLLDTMDEAYKGCKMK